MQILERVLLRPIVQNSPSVPNSILLPERDKKDLTLGIFWHNALIGRRREDFEGGSSQNIASSSFQYLIMT